MKPIFKFNTVNFPLFLNINGVANTNRNIFKLICTIAQIGFKTKRLLRRGVLSFRTVLPQFSFLFPAHRWLDEEMRSLSELAWHTQGLS